MARLNCALKVQTRSPTLKRSHSAPSAQTTRAVGMGNDARKFERRVSGAFVVGGVDAGGAQPDEHHPARRAGVHVADFDELFGGATFSYQPASMSSSMSGGSEAASSSERFRGSTRIGVHEFGSHQVLSR